MILVIDNYDSFTYNLVQYLGELGAELEAYRNDRITLEEIESLAPDKLVVSPGPCTPNEAGISVDLIRTFAGQIPILGVCLGHQSVAAAFGATISGAQRIMHGKVSMVTYDETDLYRGLENPFEGGRYHSLAIDPGTLPSELIVDAKSEDGEIMGLHHIEHATYGVQFHPESVLTPMGDRLLGNFLKLVDEYGSS